LSELAGDDPRKRARALLTAAEHSSLVGRIDDARAQANTALELFAARDDAAHTYYVATDGADTNSGTLNAPFRTILRGVQAATAGDTILVRGGVYSEEVIFDHGGAANAPITLQNYPNETPLIDGSLQVKDWTPLAGTNVWQASFTHIAAIPTNSGLEDTASESTCPDSFIYSGDRRAFLYVDDTPDANHWLKPVCVVGANLEYRPDALSTGMFATDVTPPPLANNTRYENTTNKIFLRLADDSNPNTHQIRIPAHNHGIFFWGANVNYIVVRGLSLRLQLGAVSAATGETATLGTTSSHITLDQLDISLNKSRSIENSFCAIDFNVINSHIHDIEYEGIHLESDSSSLDHTVIEKTIAPWSKWGSMGINVLGSNNRVSQNTIRNIRQTETHRGGAGGTRPGRSNAWCPRRTTNAWSSISLTR